MSSGEKTSTQRHPRPEKDVEVGQSIQPLFLPGLWLHLALTSPPNAFSWLGLAQCELWIQLYTSAPWKCSGLSDRAISVFWGDLKTNRSGVLPNPGLACWESRSLYCTELLDDPAVFESPVTQYLNILIPDSCPGMSTVRFKNRDRDPCQNSCLSFVWVRR